jgi:hypothetical protein
VIAPLELPDAPRWIEAHGMAADPESWRRALGAGFAVGNDAARLVVVAGDADPGALATLAEDAPRLARSLGFVKADELWVAA